MLESTARVLPEKAGITWISSHFRKYTAVQYPVAAISPEDAFKFAMEVEPSIPDMKLVEIVDEKPSPSLPHGVPGYPGRTEVVTFLTQKIPQVRSAGRALSSKRGSSKSISETGHGARF